MNKTLWGIWICSCFIVSLPMFSQEYENGSIDMGVGALISVGLQEEVGFDIRLQYTTSDTRTSYITEYNQYFIKELENTEAFSEFIASYNRRLFTWESIDIIVGLGYVFNNYRVLARAEDTSSLFFTSGNFNHGALLKLRGLYQINTPIHLFVEVNIKSFGKRYDTFALGLTYSLGF